jgi:hypothetical protein
MHFSSMFFFIFIGLERFSSFFEKAEKNRAAILRRIAAVFLRELRSRPDW